MEGLIGLLAERASKSSFYSPGGHRRSRPGFDEVFAIGLMPASRSVASRETLGVDRAVQAVGRFAGFNFLDKIGDAGQNSGWLVNVVGDLFDRGRTAENQVRLQPGFNRATNVRFHSVADYDEQNRHAAGHFRQLAPRAMKHV